MEVPSTAKQFDVCRKVNRAALPKAFVSDSLGPHQYVITQDETSPKQIQKPKI